MGANHTHPPDCASCDMVTSVTVGGTIRELGIGALVLMQNEHPHWLWIFLHVPWPRSEYLPLQMAARQQPNSHVTSIAKVATHCLGSLYLHPPSFMGTRVDLPEGVGVGWIRLPSRTSEKNSLRALELRVYGAGVGRVAGGGGRHGEGESTHELDL